MLLVSLLFSAAALAGTLEGTCLVASEAGSRNHSFRVASGQKASLGLDGVDGGSYKIQVANNDGDPARAAAFGALQIGFSREDARFRNPPRLCPTAPAEAREQCLAEEARNALPIQRFPREAFATGASNGVADREPDFGQGGWAGIALDLSQLRDALPVRTRAHRLGGLTLSCDAVYRR